ncbi:hypothetical protein J1N35_025260 [Gossypium stocksii]|uniref:CCHC-type domain-containing protein n=1 Tax=Gossypium stocksii TaxID=47602 RepID=A0A9D3ZWZ5_9ROSI|nr:hypothetical protein J1N35_025260 [Gossypium stocksii]
MNECELLKDHINQFITLLNELKNVEVHIDDEDQAMLLLCSLPPSYKSFRETLIYRRDKLSFEDVKGHLLSKDKLNNEFHLASKADRQASVLVASKKSDKKCRYCKKLGHIKADCYKLRNKRAAKSNEEYVAGFEKLGHCVRDNQTRVNLAVYKSKARSLPVSKHSFDSINSLHSSR